MSVILDALRRARGQAPSHPAPSHPAPSHPAPSHAAPPSGIPSALVGRPGSERNSGGARWTMLAGVIVMVAIVWAGIQFGPRLLQWGTPSPVAAAGAWAPAPEPAATRSIAETIETTTAPPAVAPRAIPETPVRAQTQTPSFPDGPLPDVRRGGPSGPPRPPVAAREAPALTTAVAAQTTVPLAVDHFALAVRYHRLGDFEQALTHYTSALQGDQFNVEARNNLGLLYNERGLTSEAIEQFRRAILIDAEYLRARSNLAVVLLNAGRLAEARAELRAALAIDPRNVDLLVNMALVDKADRLPDIARETLIRAVGLQASHAAAHYNLAILYEEAGELSRAQDHYNAFLKYAGPEYGTRLSDVRRRLEQISPRFAPQP